MGGSTKNNMTLEIIGRDPVLTMKIIKMVGERNKKAQRKKAFIQRVKQAICVWSWAQEKETPTDQSTPRRMATTTTVSSARPSRTCARFAMTATVMKHQHGRNWTMKGKCSLCETKCNDEFCQGCVYYLQRKLERALVPTRKLAPCKSDHYSDRVFRIKSNFMTLQTCQYDDGWTIYRSNKLLPSQEVDGLQINPMQKRGWGLDVLPIRNTGFGQGWDWGRGLHGVSN